MLTPKELIEQAQEKYLQEKIFRSRWKSLRASGLDDLCNRRLFYYLTCGELADEINTDLVAVFEEGKEQEPAVRRYLSELGYEIKKAGYTEIMGSHGISGQVDGTLELNGDKYIIEIKTVSEYAWGRLNNPRDFTDGYYRKWYGQMQIYLLLFNYDKGLFILKRKQAKQLRIIEVELDYEYAEQLLKKAEIVNAALLANSAPAFLSNNPAECKKCPFFSKVCNPPIDYGFGPVNIENQELEGKLARRAKLEPGATEYEALDKEIKEQVRDIPESFCGDWHIVVKDREVTRYEVPEDVKVQYKIKTISKVVKIEKLTDNDSTP